MTNDTNPPEVQFDHAKAIRIFPRPNLKHAVLVPIPQAASGDDLPTFIEAEWGQPQVFYGSYYAIIKGDRVIYGSARVQWEAMHSAVGTMPGFWVKTAIPIAYQATEVCRVVTLIPTEGGSVREANFILKPGDWVVRQPGGEVQHIKQEKAPQLYYSMEEAMELGLHTMSAEQFATWAIAQATLLATA